jgi:DNA-binding NtrC family response regulator
VWEIIVTNGETSILIVEDESAIRALLVALLGQRFRCQTADTAEAALGMLNAQSFHLVLADVGLPGATSGLDLCRAIAARKARPAVVLISGKMDSEAANEAREARAFDFISKPFDLVDVMATVDCALAFQSEQAAMNSAVNDALS